MLPAGFEQHGVQRRVGVRIDGLGHARRVGGEPHRLRRPRRRQCRRPRRKEFCLQRHDFCSPARRPEIVVPGRHHTRVKVNIGKTSRIPIPRAASDNIVPPRRGRQMAEARRSRQGRSVCCTTKTQSRRSPSVFRLVHCGTVAGHGRRHPRHPVQGRSLRRALRRWRSTRDFSRRPASTLPALFPAKAAALRCAPCSPAASASARPRRAAAIAAINAGQDIKIVDIGTRLACRQRDHRAAEFADQVGQGSQGQEIRHQQSQIARRDDDGPRPKRPASIPTISSASRSAISRALSRRLRITSSMRPPFPASCSLDARRRQQIPRHPRARRTCRICRPRPESPPAT